MTVSVVCPVCHGKLVSVYPTLNKDTDEVLYYTGYCSSLRCRVKRVVLTREFRVVGYNKHKSLKSKKKAIYSSIKRKYQNSRITYKAKVREKYLKLKSEFE